MISPSKMIKKARIIRSNNHTIRSYGSRVPRWGATSPSPSMTSEGGFVFDKNVSVF